ncbi:MAG TPA: thiamine phosphate synthase, partial [Phycisphaerae bacterium]|nr:thiamine phosphate synthase [Phycisphaerae bacterium]
IGRSTSRLADARLAQDEGADYIGVGAMFPSPTKPEKPVQGLRLLTEVAPFINIPIVAIGGVTAENAASIAGALPEGATCPIQAAVCQAIIAAQTVTMAAQLIRSELSGRC